MPSVDHMFNQGMLNLLLDRAFSGLPPQLPQEFAEVGLYTNLVRLTDKSLREYDAARFELLDYLDGWGAESRKGLRTSPYIRAIDHMENLVSALARGINCIDALRSRGVDRNGSKIPNSKREDVTRMRDMIEHTDDRLTKSSTRMSRPTFEQGQPYALRLENEFMLLGNWMVRYEDLAAAVSVLYESVARIRGTRAAGSDHPQAATRTSVVFIGTPPNGWPRTSMMASDELWEMSRQSVNH